MLSERTIIDFEIIWKKINHTLTEKEETFLSQWLNESPEHPRYLENAINYYTKGSAFSENKEETEKVWKTFINKELKGKHNNSTRIISVAAAAITIFLVSTFLFSTIKIKFSPIVVNKAEIIKPGTNQATLILDNGSVYDLAASKNLILMDGSAEIKSEGTKLQYTEKAVKNKEVKYNTLNIPRGGEFFLELSDGTKVWLNSETVLRYPVSFTGKERKVELIGEAFFQVARNEKVPFLVESGEQTLKVLGTEFNISCYKENTNIYTTLVSGSIEVSIKNNQETKQLLTPNEQSSVRKTEGKIYKQTVDPYLYVAWKEGRFVFEDQKLDEIMQTLSKWYNVEVVFERDDMRNIRFTGNLPRYSDFNEVLKKMGKTNEVSFSIENKQIKIR